MNLQTFGTAVVVSAMESFMVFVNVTKGRVSKLLGARMVLLSLGGRRVLVYTALAISISTCLMPM